MDGGDGRAEELTLGMEETRGGGAADGLECGRYDAECTNDSGIFCWIGLLYPIDFL